MTGDDLRPLLARADHRYPGEVMVTPFSGIEYGLDDDGRFAWAWLTVSGADLTEEEFVAEVRWLLGD
jgi:hypothetical protein